MTEVGAEIISLKSDSECCKSSPNPKLSMGNSNNERNSRESLPKKFFYLRGSGKEMVSTFWDLLGEEGKENEGKVSSIMPISSVLKPVPKLNNGI